MRSRKARFLIDADDIEYRVNAMRRNVRQIQVIAEARYRDLRGRFEQAFRDEIMGTIYQAIMSMQQEEEVEFFVGDDPLIVRLLRRMIDFWAFSAVILVWRNEDGQVCPISYATDDPANSGYGFGFANVHDIGTITAEASHLHPVCWLYDPERTALPRNGVVRQVYERLIDAKPLLAKFGIPTDGCYFLVIVPFEGTVYAFVFAERRKELLSRTDAKKSSSVSELCRESMLRTCTEIVSEICDLRFRQEHSG
jgi:hypothetical protein